MSQRPVEFRRLAYVNDPHLAQMLLEPVRLHFPDAGEGVSERRPVRLLRRLMQWLPALQVRRNRGLHLLRVRKAEVGHVADEVVLANGLGEARVEELLLADTGHAQAAVVVSRIDQAALGQREDALAHAAEQRARVALLEVGATAA